MTRLFVTLALLGTLLLTAVTGASAGPAGSASNNTAENDGTFETTSFTGTNERKVGTDTFIDVTAVEAYTGRLTGTSVIRGNLIFHDDGTASFYEINTFTGTIDGVSGVVTFYSSGGGGADGSAQGTATVVNAAGDLAGLTGHVDTVGVATPGKGVAGTYTVDLEQGGGNDGE